MGLVTETGTGIPDANGYITVAFADEYHLDRRNDAWNGANVEVDYKEGAIIRGTAFVDNAYRGRFSGYPRLGRAQGLQWPRSGAMAAGFYYGSDTTTLPADQVPRELMQAVCEAALRELVKPGCLMPDLKQGGEIKSVAAGSVNVTFAGGLTGQNFFQLIDALLAPLLSPVVALGGRTGRC